MSQIKRGFLVVDGANWSMRLEEYKQRIDYELLIAKIQSATGITLTDLSYYTAYRTEADLDRRWGFMNYLKNRGWQVQAMPATLGADGIWRDKEVDVSIALDAYEGAISRDLDAILIGSGDEDFAALFRRLPENVEGWAISFKNCLSKTIPEVAKVLLVEDLGVLQPTVALKGLTEPQDAEVKQVRSTR